MIDLSTDRTLLTRIQSGNTLALEELYDRDAALLYSLAMRILRHEPDPVAEAEAVLIEAFDLVWHDAAEVLRTDGSSRAWLVCRVRERALARRSLRRRPVVENPTRMPGEAVPGQLTGAGLSARQSLAMDLAYFDGCSVAELSLTLNETPAAVRALIATAMDVMRMPDLPVGD